VGVHPDTVYKWLKAGAETDAEDSLREFFRLVHKTERSVKIRALGIIQQAQDGDWKAAAWWLERKYPDEYGRRDRLRLDATAQIQAKVTLEEDVEAALSDPEARELLDQLAIRAATVNLRSSSNGNGSQGLTSPLVEGQPGGNGSTPSG
jgi:hypothetical protein